MDKRIVNVRGMDGVGLGIIAYPFLITCAHVNNGYPSVLSGNQFLVEAEKVWSKASIQLPIVSVDCGFDLMILGESPRDLISDEEEVGERSIFLEGSDDDIENIRPAKFIFSKGKNSAKFKGYFFLQDGATKFETEFWVSIGSPIIQFQVEHQFDYHGCSGGPIFSRDGKLVGIVQQVHTLAGKTVSQGTRLDLCLSNWILGHYEKLDELALE